MRRALVAFLVVAFGWSGLVALAVLLLPALHPVAKMGLAILYMFGPAAGAIVAQRMRGEGVLGPLDVKLNLTRSTIGWWLVAWLSPLAYALLAGGIGVLLPGVTLSLDFSGLLDRMAPQLTAEQLAQAQAQLATLPRGVLVAVTLAQVLVAGISVNAIAALGEELGWRAFMPRAVDGGFWRKSVVIGLVWGVWHAPLVLQGHNYPQHPVAGVFMMTAWCVLLTPWHLHIRERTGSVLGAAVLHGSLNAAGGVAIMALRGGGDLLVGVTGLAGFLALIPVNLWVAWSRRRPPSGR